MSRTLLAFAPPRRFSSPWGQPAHAPAHAPGVHVGAIPATVHVGAFSDRTKTYLITGSIGAGFALAGAAMPMLIGLTGASALLAAGLGGAVGGLAIGFLVDAVATTGSTG